MAGLILLLLIAVNVLRIRLLTPYLVLGLGLWFFVHESGVHATIAGVLLAFAIPTRTRINAEEFYAEARGLLEYFDRTETGDLLVLTSKGQQEAIIGLERAPRWPQCVCGWPRFQTASVGRRCTDAPGWVASASRCPCSLRRLPLTTRPCSTRPQSGSWVGRFSRVSLEQSLFAVALAKQPQDIIYSVVVRRNQLREATSRPTCRASLSVVAEQILARDAARYETSLKAAAVRASGRLSTGGPYPRASHRLSASRRCRALQPART
jgi:hypothetical protein